MNTKEFLYKLHSAVENDPRFDGNLAAFARHAGMAQPTVDRILRADTDPLLSNVLKIVAGLGQPLHEAFGEPQQPQTPIADVIERLITKSNQAAEQLGVTLNTHDLARIIAANYQDEAEDKNININGSIKLVVSNY